MYSKRLGYGESRANSYISHNRHPKLPPQIGQNAGLHWMKLLSAPVNALKSSKFLSNISQGMNITSVLHNGPLWSLSATLLGSKTNSLALEISPTGRKASEPPLGTLVIITNVQNIIQHPVWILILQLLSSFQPERIWGLKSVTRINHWFSRF